MPFITTHTATHGKGTYDVLKLIRRVGKRASEKIALKTVNINRSPKSGFSRARMMKANIKKPILIAPDNSLLDGRHRAARLESMGRRHIEAIRVTEEDLKHARVKSRVPVAEQHDHYSVLPIRKPGFHLTGRKSKELPETWVEDYTTALHALTHLNLNKPLDAARAEQLNSFLDRLEAEARTAGRGGIFRPKPGPLNIYPKVTVSMPHLKTAIRANSPAPTRERAWENATIAEDFRPSVGESVRKHMEGKLDNHQERSFMQAAAVGLPIAHGRTPHFLGQKVPGEVHLGPVGTATIIGGEQMSSSDWARGFSPMKFDRREDSLMRRNPYNRSKRHDKKTLRNVATYSGKDMAIRIAKRIGGFGLGVGSGMIIGPAIETPGFKKGFERGVRGDQLSQREAIGRRFLPGYMGGYMQGRVAAGRIARPATTPAKYAFGFGGARRLIGVAKHVPLERVGQVGKAGIGEFFKGAASSAGGAALTAGGGYAAVRLTDRRREKEKKRHAHKHDYSNPTSLKTMGKMVKTRFGKVFIAHSPLKTVLPYSYSSLTEEQCYEYGFTQGIKDHWHRFIDSIRDNLVPSAIRGAFVGGLGKAHQEIGLPPTTVDGIPVVRRSMSGQYAPYTTLQLRRAQASMVNNMDNASSPSEKKVIEDARKNLMQEITLREQLPSA